MRSLFRLDPKSWLPTLVMGSSILGALTGTVFMVKFIPHSHLVIPLCILWFVCVLVYLVGASLRYLAGEARRQQLRSGLREEMDGTVDSEVVEYDDDQGPREAYSYTVQFQINDRTCFLQEVFFEVLPEPLKGAGDEKSQLLEFDALRFTRGASLQVPGRVRIQPVGSEESLFDSWQNNRTEFVEHHIRVLVRSDKPPNQSSPEEEGASRYRELQDPDNEQFMNEIESLLQLVWRRGPDVENGIPLFVFQEDSVEAIMPVSPDLYDRETLRKLDQSLDTLSRRIVEAMNNR